MGVQGAMAPCLFSSWNKQKKATPGLAGMALSCETALTQVDGPCRVQLLKSDMLSHR